MQPRKQRQPIAHTQHHDAPRRCTDIGWDDLKVFHAVAASGSMRAAGSELTLNASTISRRLGALERALGAKLFERHPEGLRLTAAGVETLELAKRLNSGVDELQRRVRGRDQRLEGDLRVSVAEILGAWSCTVLAALSREHPGLNINLDISDALLDVDRHQTDLVVRVADAAPSQLVGRRVGKSGVGLYASTGYLERHGTELGNPSQRWVSWPRAVEHKPAFRWLQTQYPQRLAVLRGNCATTVLRAVRSGVGIAPLPHCQAAEEPSLVCLRQLPDQCSTPVWLLTHRDLQRTAKVRAAFEAFAQAFKAHAPRFVSGTSFESPAANGARV